MTKIHSLGVLLASLLITSSPWAHAHARWKLDGLLPPRSNDTGLKIAPCGGKARTDNPVQLTAGTDVTVEWEETIDHPGYFTIAFSPAGDAGFENNVLYRVDDTQGPETPMPHFYSATITLPNEPCTDCTLQLIQYMTENPDVPRLYYSCTDIELVSDSVTPPEPNPGTGTSTLSLTDIAAGLKEDFDALDGDGNGELDIVEAQSGIPDLDVSQFNEIDTDTNGKIVVAELDAVLGVESIATPAPEVQANHDEGNDSGGGAVLWTLLLSLFMPLTSKRGRD